MRVSDWTQVIVQFGVRTMSNVKPQSFLPQFYNTQHKALPYHNDDDRTYHKIEKTGVS